MYDLIFSVKFHVIMSAVLFLNLFTLALEHYNQSDNYNQILNIIDTFFVTIFGLEILLQLFALRQHFFRNMWNVYSLLVTILCLICKNNFKKRKQKFMVIFIIFSLTA